MSEGKYFNITENNFCVLPDGKTLVGGALSGSLLVEDITKKEAPLEIGKGSGIYTMIFNRRVNSLLVGYGNGCVSQFEKDSSGILRKQKEYKNVGVGEINASDCSGDFAVVGGSNGMVILIHMRNKKVIGKGIKTAIGCVNSLQFCRVSETEMHLAVGGNRRDYSNSKTDLFDVSGIFKKRGKITRKGKTPLTENEKSLIDQNKKLQQELQKKKMENKEMKKTIEKLKSRIKREIIKKTNARTQKDQFNKDNQKLEDKNIKKKKEIKKIKKNVKALTNINVNHQMKIIMHLKNTVDTSASKKK